MNVTKLADLVTPEEVRALLGVEDVELPDERIALPIYYKHVRIAVGSLDQRLWPAYLALNVDRSTWSPEQERFASAFEAYVGIKAAQAIGVALPQLSPRVITDSKAANTRQSDSAMDVLGNLADAAATYGTELIASAVPILPVIPNVVSVAGILGRATLGAADPVTG